MDGSSQVIVQSKDRLNKHDPVSTWGSTPFQGNVTNHNHHTVPYGSSKNEIQGPTAAMGPDTRQAYMAREVGKITREFDCPTITYAQSAQATQRFQSQTMSRPRDACRIEPIVLQFHVE